MLSHHSTEKVSEEKVVAACKVACIDEFISGLPEGYNTVIGAQGEGLSEGQNQRNAIARTIYSGAPVMLLDEATSALDQDNGVLGKIRDQEIARGVIQRNDFVNLTKDFRKNEIRYVPLKGSIIKGLYPRIDMRFMSNVDIMIDEKNMQKAGTINTEEHGFECESHNQFCHDTFLKLPVSNIELHRKLFSASNKEH